MNEHEAENDAGCISRRSEVYHRYHGNGIVSTISPDRQYATVRYEAGYTRTHCLVELTRVIPPENGGAS